MKETELITNIEQMALFNYSGIDHETTNYLKQNAHETRGLLKRTAEDIIKIGQNLMEAKARLPHGQFIPWVKAELGISQSTAWRFMQVAQGKEIKKSFTMNDFFEQISTPSDGNDYEGWIAYNLCDPYPDDPLLRAVHDVLMTGILLNRVCKNKTDAEIDEFALSEFGLMPGYAVQYMLNAAHHPGNKGILHPNVVNEMVALKARNELARKDVKLQWLMDTARCFSFAKLRLERKSQDFPTWVEARYPILAHVAETLIGFLEEYIRFPWQEHEDGTGNARIEEVPDEFVQRCFDLERQYELFDIRIGFDVVNEVNN